MGVVVLMIEHIQTTKIICDYCGKTLTFHNNDTYAINWAIKNAWKIGDKIRCPDCVGRDL